jgi:hypothetical protein
MPHNSCTIILNGHGQYTPDKIVNMMSCPTDYNMVFPCKHKEVITTAHHNFILADLSCCPKDQITSRLEIIETLGTTSIVNKQASAMGVITDMMTSQHLSIFYEHALSNAPDVMYAHTLEQTNGHHGNPASRFHGTELVIIPDPTHIRGWGNSNLHFEFDIIEAETNVKANLQQDSSDLSKDNLLCITPIAPPGQQATFMLSDLISDILPKIKLFASKHTDGSVDVLPHVFLDDLNDSIQNLANCVQNFPAFQHPGDKLHELTIAGDANIIWDACREL